MSRFYVSKYLDTFREVRDGRTGRMDGTLQNLRPGGQVPGLIGTVNWRRISLL